MQRTAASPAALLCIEAGIDKSISQPPMRCESAATFRPRYRGGG
jgi:hypothetical protein